MKTQFYLLLSLKSQNGYNNFGQYFVGDNRQNAYELFEQLQGSDVPQDNALLHMDLMETVDDLPVRIRSICCTLGQLTANCKLITKEIFRLQNLEDIL